MGYVPFYVVALVVSWVLFGALCFVQNPSHKDLKEELVFLRLVLFLLVGPLAYLIVVWAKGSNEYEPWDILTTPQETYVFLLVEKQKDKDNQGLVNLPPGVSVQETLKKPRRKKAYKKKPGKHKKSVYKKLQE